MACPFWGAHQGGDHEIQVKMESPILNIFLRGQKNKKSHNLNFNINWVLNFFFMHIYIKYLTEKKIFLFLRYVIQDPDIRDLHIVPITTRCDMS